MRTIVSRTAGFPNAYLALTALSISSCEIPPRIKSTGYRQLLVWGSAGVQTFGKRPID
jgi:hypothetical protein